MQWEIKKIIENANCLASTGRSGGSSGEVIAAAFVLNRMEFLPASYQDVVEAWDRLDDEWQEYVRIVKRDHQHLEVGLVIEQERSVWGIEVKMAACFQAAS
ncbi:hypothetical protein [Ketobacter sp.]|nr:MAG: hypothetical protein D6160_06240 [Ketobacter sp.]